MKNSMLFTVYMLTALLAGAARYLSTRGVDTVISIRGLITTIIISVFVGLLLTFICFELTLHPAVGGVLVGVGAFEGISVLTFIKKRLNTYLPFKSFFND